MKPHQVTQPSSHQLSPPATISPDLCTSLMMDLHPMLTFLSHHYLVISFLSYPIFHALLIPGGNYITHGRSSKCDVMGLVKPLVRFAPC